MGKNRYTQNQDYFKLSGSSPERNLVSSDKQAFTMQRTRERISDALKKSTPPWMSSRMPPVERSEVIEPSHGQGEARGEPLQDGVSARAHGEIHMTSGGTPPAEDMPTPSVLGLLREMLMLPVQALRHPVALASWLGRMARERFDRFADVGRRRMQQA
jgi:hypothetical protein